MRGEIEHEVERELAARRRIDERARRAEAEGGGGRGARGEREARGGGGDASGDSGGGGAGALLELREKHETRCDAEGAARLERILADRVATAEDVSAEAGVAAASARIEARAAGQPRAGAREDLEEVTREKSARDAKIDDAAAVVRSREDDAERWSRAAESLL